MNETQLKNWFERQNVYVGQPVPLGYLHTLILLAKKKNFELVFFLGRCFTHYQLDPQPSEVLILKHNNWSDIHKLYSKGLQCRS